MSKLYNGPKLWSEVLKFFPEGTIIAGGCVRDFYMQKKPKDIDIFLPVDNDPDYNWQTALAEAGAEPIHVDDSNYEGTVIRYVDNYDWNGFDLNIIGIKADPVEYMYGFDLGTSMALFDGNLFYTEQFLKDMVNGTVTIVNPHKYREHLEIGLERTRTRAERFIKNNPEFTLVDPTTKEQEQVLQVNLGAWPQAVAPVEGAPIVFNNDRIILDGGLNGGGAQNPLAMP